MATLDQILNWAIPIGIILIFASMFYVKMKEPVDNLFRWIGKLFGWGAEKVTETITGNGEGYVVKYG